LFQQQRPTPFLRGDCNDQAIITRLVYDRGYGFFRTPDGREIYFHRHSVLNGHFARLSVGMLVRFAEEDGDDGIQARTVQVIDNRSGPSR
jgi:cold shock CspA family protein